MHKYVHVNDCVSVCVCVFVGLMFVASVLEHSTHKSHALYIDSEMNNKQPQQQRE